MKLKIERLQGATRGGDLRLELTHDTAKAPLVVELSRLQAEGLVQILAAATKAQAFRMEVEI